MKLSTKDLQTAVHQINTHGFVIFPSVLSRNFIAKLHAAFMKNFADYIARTDPNRGANRYQMHLPFMPPFIDPQVIENSLVLSIVDALLGDDCVCHYFASDTPLPGSDYQKVHSDIHALFPETGIVPPAYSLVLNIPLVDFREDNGPLEIWPNTHTLGAHTDIEKLAAQKPSERVRMPAGSLLIRDMRMWHRGTPNASDNPRPNLALIFSRHWLKTQYPPIAIPAETYARLSKRAKKLFRLENIGGDCAPAVADAH